MAHKTVEYTATGRRKTSSARVRMALGVGKMIINGQESAAYFESETTRLYIDEPFRLTNTEKRFDVIAKVEGGGKVGQAGAVRLGIARALLKVDEAHRAALKAQGCLTRDPRMKERKKTGQPGARKRFQFSKR